MECSDCAHFGKSMSGWPSLAVGLGFRSDEGTELSCRVVALARLWRCYCCRSAAVVLSHRH